MYMSIYTYIHLYIYTYIHIYIYTFINIYMYAYTQIYIYTYPRASQFRHRAYNSEWKSVNRIMFMMICRDLPLHVVFRVLSCLRDLGCKIHKNQKKNYQKLMKNLQKIKQKSTKNHSSTQVCFRLRFLIDF